MIDHSFNKNFGNKFHQQNGPNQHQQPHKHTGQLCQCRSFKRSRNISPLFQKESVFEYGLENKWENYCCSMMENWRHPLSGGHCLSIKSQQENNSFRTIINMDKYRNNSPIILIHQSQVLQKLQFPP